jgi:hypothetical protein
MRTPALLIGIVLLIVGGLISSGMLGFDRQETVAKLGPIEVTSTEHKKPAPLVGYGLLGAGALLLVVGLSARK